jgi:hypothetical protein
VILLKKRANFPERVTESRVSYFSMISYTTILYELILRSGIAQLRETTHLQGVSCIFNKTVMIHSANTTEWSVEEMKIVGMVTSFSRIVTVPLEKLFGLTRMHIDVQRTMITELKTIQHDHTAILLHEDHHSFK